MVSAIKWWRRTRDACLVTILCLGLVLSGRLLAQAPVVYRVNLLGGVETAGPDELVRLSGIGLDAQSIVSYQKVESDEGVFGTSLPQAQGNTTGVGGVPVPLIIEASSTSSIVVRMPHDVSADTPYWLSVRNPLGQVSDPVKVNDPRVNWFSPAQVYATRTIAGLPRQLRLVGRNLSINGTNKWVLRLAGLRGSFELELSSDKGLLDTTAHYTAVADLPKRLPVGTYRVSLRIGNSSWQSLEQSLVVKADPSDAGTIPVSAFGCTGSPTQDATRCIRAALAKAAQMGATVLFERGTWMIGDLNGHGPDSSFLVPPGVKILGVDPAQTTIVRGPGALTGKPVFILEGSNEIRRVRLSDLERHTQSDGPTFVQVGRPYHQDPKGIVDDIVISEVIFDGTFTALADAGRPISHLYLTHNVFGSYAYGLMLHGDAGNLEQRFSIRDSVIRYNVFKTGSLMDRSRLLGPIASQLGGSYRLDLSDNTVDGASRDFLYDKQSNVTGWRAALFFAMRGNHEHVLVASNVITCPGDRIGDGEAIVFDNNQNDPGLEAASSVISATSNSVTIKDKFREEIFARHLPAHYFDGYFVQVVDGRGIGQSRRLEHYQSDDNSELSVTPAWEVIPDNTSRVVVVKAVWDALIVGNYVDQRQPLCSKANPSGPDGGVVSFYANTISSIISGNKLFDTGGIALRHQYTIAHLADQDGPEVSFEYGVEVRGNLIDGEYLWDSDRSWSGIALGLAASPSPTFTPPTAGFGEVIEGNTIRHADALAGGAISIVPTWFEGAAPHQWHFIDGAIIANNKIVDITGSPATRGGGFPAMGITTPRVGIRIADKMAWNVLLSGNICTNVAKSLVDNGVKTWRRCEKIASAYCECH